VSDAFDAQQTIHRAERTERVPVSYDPSRQGRSDVPETLNFLDVGDVKIDRASRLWRRLLGTIPFGFAQTGSTGGVRCFYLQLERIARL